MVKSGCQHNPPSIPPRKQLPLPAANVTHPFHEGRRPRRPLYQLQPEDSRIKKRFPAAALYAICLDNLSYPLFLALVLRAGVDEGAEGDDEAYPEPHGCGNDLDRRAQLARDGLIGDKADEEHEEGQGECSA